MPEIKMDHLNPFQYGGIVGPEAFCNREQELKDLTRACENGDRLFVYAERRMGKTSLVKQVLRKLESRRFVPIYVDLWPTDGPDAFANATARSMAEASARRADKVLEAAKELFSRLHPSLTLDESGNPSIQFGARVGARQSPALDQVLSAPPRIAEKLGRRVVVVFDEFQQILGYEDDEAERVLRSAVQDHDGIAYLFLGSRKHLVEDLFSDTRRPLYRSAGHYPLETIDTVHWIPFIHGRFERAGKSISAEVITRLCDLSDGHPFYTQHLAHALWERTPSGSTVGSAAIDEALDLLLDRESYAFATRWETLTTNQQRCLRGLATAAPVLAPYSADFVQTYGLGTPSSAQRAVKSLLKLDLIDRNEGAFFVTDRFFRLWISRL